MDNSPVKIKTPINAYRIIQILLGILFGGYLIFRVYQVFFVEQVYGPDTWARFTIAGLVLGSVYALIAIGYTLVYGILFMINFAHGEIMMIGAFGGFFVFEALGNIIVGGPSDPELTFLNAQPILSVIIAFLVGMTLSAISG